MLSALFRWPIEQRYVMAHPFSDVKVRGCGPVLDTKRAFAKTEWAIVRTLADELEEVHPALAEKLRRATPH